LDMDLDREREKESPICEESCRERREEREG
jgi:hypothetical protein